MACFDDFPMLLVSYAIGGRTGDIFHEDIL